MYVDNKKSDSDVKYVLLEGIGQCKNEKGSFLLTVGRNEVRGVIERFVGQHVRHFAAAMERVHLSAHQNDLRRIAHLFA